MNIFSLSLRSTPYMNIKECAAFHCDRHVVKMINEYTQMLVTALNYPLTAGHITSCDPTELIVRAPCKPLSNGHMKHPCTIWTRSSHINFAWLQALALELIAEHQLRYPMSPEHCYAPWLRLLNSRNKGTLAIPPRLPLAIHYISEREADWPLAVQLYRQYYICEKFHIATWKNRSIPSWFEDGVSCLYKTEGG